MVIMSSVRSILPPPSRSDAPLRMSEEEFVEWCDSDTWAEWVDGTVVMMAPVGTGHAQLTAFFITLMRMYAEEHDLGDVLTEPYQIRFAKLRRRRSPDLIFVSSTRAKLYQKSHFEGAPDLVVEIVSPESQSRDRREKYLEYQAAGVREYWIVDPQSQQVEVHALGSGKKYAQVGEVDGKIKSTVLSGFFIRPQWLWKIKPPKVSTLLKEIAGKR